MNLQGQKNKTDQKSKTIFLSSPTTHSEEMVYVSSAFAANQVMPIGANLNAFEDDIAEYVGVKHAVATDSGTSALHLANKAVYVRERDIVFCSDLTFAASANPISYQNAIQVFIDSEKDTWNMDPRALEMAFRRYPHPKAVVCVNLYGTPAKLDEIRQLCNAHSVPLIEDAAESLGAEYKGKKCGSFGDISILSFNGNKIITTSSGGMFLTNNEHCAKKAKYWATQSRDPVLHYQHSEIGYNYRMSNVLAGIGRGQFIHLQEHVDKKEDIYSTYKRAFEDLPITMNPYLCDTKPNFWLSSLLIDPECRVTPYEIIAALAMDNIEARYIWKPMHMQPVFADKEFISVEKKISVSEHLFRFGVCLPSDIKMDEDDMTRVISIVRSVFGK